MKCCILVLLSLAMCSTNLTEKFHVQLSNLSQYTGNVYLAFSKYYTSTPCYFTSTYSGQINQDPAFTMTSLEYISSYDYVQYSAGSLWMQFAIGSGIHVNSEIGFSFAVDCLSPQYSIVLQYYVRDYNNMTEFQGSLTAYSGASSISFSLLLAIICAMAMLI